MGSLSYQCATTALHLKMFEKNHILLLSASSASIGRIRPLELNIMGTLFYHCVTTVGNIWKKCSNTLLSLQAVFKNLFSSSSTNGNRLWTLAWYKNNGFIVLPMCYHCSSCLKKTFFAIFCFQCKHRHNLSSQT